MAQPTETIARPGGFGARRFLVRGPDFLSEEALGIIRPRITDYPERRPFFPEFPAPGRRGASRPPAERQAFAPAPGTGGGTYPMERDRTPTPLKPADTTGISAKVGACCPEEGDSSFSSPLVTAATSRVVVTPRIARAFWVFHLQYWSGATAPDPVLQMALAIKVSDDNDTSGGLDTTGINILQLGFGISAVGTVFEPYNVVQQHYPTSPVFTPGNFIKFAWRNNSAGDLHSYATISIKYRD